MRYSTRLKVLLVLLATACCLQWVGTDWLVMFIQRYPSLQEGYDFVTRSYQHPSYTGLVALIFASSLFFSMFVPRAPIFIFFCRSPAMEPVPLVVLASLAMLLAMLVNYVLGATLVRLLLALRGRRKTSGRIGRMMAWGGAGIVGVGYLIPVGFPHGLAALTAGTMRVSLRSFCIVSLVGVPLHFLILYHFQDYFHELLGGAATLPA